MKKITLATIVEKNHKFQGRVIQGRTLGGLSAEVVVGESVRIFGTYENHIQPHFSDRTLKVGEVAEYGSYNYSYTGVIRSITEKTVTIACTSTGEVRRLSMYEFCWRNWDFDAEKTAKRNLDLSYTL